MIPRSSPSELPRMVPHPTASPLPRFLLLIGPPASQWLLIGCLCLTAVGCREEGRTVTIPERRSVTRGAGGVDDFEKAFELIDRLDEFDAEQVMSQAAYHLTRWLGSQPAASDWQLDPLVVESLTPLGMGNMRSLRNADSRNMGRADVQYLQESLWLREISIWGAEPRDNPLLTEQIETATQGRETGEAEQLAKAIRLFDWTVRNVQLVAPPERPAEASAESQRERSPPAARGEPGLGYTQLPWEILLFGQGDHWQRARIFMLLTRQAGIDSFMLAIPPEGFPESNPDLKPWAVGTRIGQEVFLFDPHLGLPLPGPNLKGVLTLRELLADPRQLAALDVGDTLRYGTRPEQVAEVGEMIALVDATSESLSFRMRSIQDRLTGTRRMTLVAEPTRIAYALREVPGIRETRVWSIPLEAELFQAAWADLRRRDSRAAAMYEQRMILFASLSPLRLARQLYFRRQFERDDEKPGAVMKLMEARVPEREIDAIPTSDAIRAKLGLQRMRTESEEAYGNRLRVMQRLIRDGKDNASYWLGLTHLENQDYSNAVNWFQRRTLDSAPDSIWTDGARYNLARALESQGKYVAARDQYLLDRSPQRHGNLLRARYLRLHKIEAE